MTSQLEPVFGLGLGFTTIASAAWIIMFSVRHRGPLFLIFATALMLCGVTTVVFADVVQASFVHLFQML